MKKIKTAIEYDYVVRSIGTKNDPAYEAVVPTLNAIVYGDSAAELESGIREIIEAQRRHLKMMPERDIGERSIAKKFVTKIWNRVGKRIAA